MADKATKTVEIEIKAEGAGDVRRAFASISASLNLVRSVGGRSLGILNTGMGTLLRGAGGALDIFTQLGRSVAGLVSSAAKFSLAGAVATAGSLLTAINRVKDATMTAIEEENRLVSSAAIFNLNPRLGSELAAEMMYALEYAFDKVNAAEPDEVKDIITPLLENAALGLKGDEAALDLLGGLGLTPDDIIDAKGQLYSMDVLLGNVIKSYDRLKKEKGGKESFFAGAVAMFGDTDAQKLATLAAAGFGAYEKNMRTAIQMRDLRVSDIEISKRLGEAMADEKVAYDNLGTSIKRGFGAALADVTRLRTEFIEGWRPQMESLAELLGRSYGRIAAGLIAEADKLTDALSGPTGDLIDGPLEGWLIRIEGLFLGVVGVARGLFEYLATGTTDNAWAKSIGDSFVWVKDAISAVYEQSLLFAKWVREEAYPAVEPFILFIDDLLEKVGADQPWEKVGIVAGLILFKGTVGAALGVGGRLVSMLAGVTAQAIAAAGPLAAIATAIAAISAYAGAKSGSGIVGSAKSGQDYFTYIKEINDRLAEQGKTEGEIAAFLQVATEAYKQKNGDSNVVSLLNKLDSIPILGGAFTSEQEILDYMTKAVQEEMRKPGGPERVRAARMDAQKEWEEQEVPGKVVVNGIEMDRAVLAEMEELRKGLTVPLRFEIQGGLSELAGQTIEYQGTKTNHPSFGLEGEGFLNPSEGVRVDNLYIGGENVGSVILSPSAYDAIRYGQSVSRRTR